MNHFQLLGLPESAQLDEDLVKERYHELISQFHPDKATSESEKVDFNQRSTELNQAWKTLSDPVQRTRHLLLVQDPGGKLDAPLSPELMDLFAKVGSVIQESDAFLAKKSQASSALLRALLAEEEIQVQKSLQTMLSAVTQEQNAADLAVTSLDQLKILYGRLSFLQKWHAQLSQRVLHIISDK